MHKSSTVDPRLSELDGKELSLNTEMTAYFEWIHDMVSPCLFANLLKLALPFLGHLEHLLVQYSPCSFPTAIYLHTYTRNMCTEMGIN